MKIKQFVHTSIDGNGAKQNYISWKCDKCGAVGYNWVGQETELSNNQIIHCEKD